jgi:hypothetical protein
VIKLIKKFFKNFVATTCWTIIKNILNYDHHMSKEEKEELFMMLNMILEQNYFQCNNQFFKQDEGFTMGPPTSAILAETFIQYLKHTTIYQILNKHQIIDLSICRQYSDHIQ